MLRLNPHRPRVSLGQYGASAQIDPLLRLSLESAGAILSTRDPGANETVQLIERIIVAVPQFPTFGGAPNPPKKISDINPYLSGAATVIEHPIAIGLGLLALPVFAYLLGRRSRS